MTDRDPTINVRLRKSGRTKHFTIFEAGAYGWHTCDPDTGGQITQLRDWEAALTRRAAYDAEIAELIEHGWIPHERGDG